MTAQNPSCRWLSDEQLLCSIEYSVVKFVMFNHVWLPGVHPAEDFGNTLLKPESIETSQQSTILLKLPFGISFFGFQRRIGGNRWRGEEKSEDVGVNNDEYLPFFQGFGGMVWHVFTRAHHLRVVWSTSCLRKVAGGTCDKPMASIVWSIRRYQKTCFQRLYILSG